MSVRMVLIGVAIAAVVGITVYRPLREVTGVTEVGRIARNQNQGSDKFVPSITDTPRAPRKNRETSQQLSDKHKAETLEFIAKPGIDREMGATMAKDLEDMLYDLATYPETYISVFVDLLKSHRECGLVGRKMVEIAIKELPDPVELAKQLLVQNERSKEQDNKSSTLEKVSAADCLALTQYQMISITNNLAIDEYRKRFSYQDWAFALVVSAKDKNQKNVAFVREVLSLLSKLENTSPGEIEEIIQSRPQAEQEAYEDFRLQ